MKRTHGSISRIEVYLYLHLRIPKGGWLHSQPVPKRSALSPTSISRSIHARLRPLAFRLFSAPIYRPFLFRHSYWNSPTIRLSIEQKWEWNFESSIKGPTQSPRTRLPIAMEKNAPSFVLSLSFTYAYMLRLFSTLNTSCIVRDVSEA